MGYRSQAAIALTKNGAQAMQKYLALADEATKDAVSDMLTESYEAFWRALDGSELYFWDSVKWYEDDREGYPEIKFFQELFDKLPDKDYLFVRIGENLDDAEMRGSFYENPFDLSILRDILFEIGPAGIGEPQCSFLK